MDEAVLVDEVSAGHAHAVGAVVDAGERLVDVVDRPAGLFHVRERVEAHGLRRPVAAVRLDIVCRVEADGVLDGRRLLGNLGAGGEKLLAEVLEVGVGILDVALPVDDRAFGLPGLVSLALLVLHLKGNRHRERDVLRRADVRRQFLFRRLRRNDGRLLGDDLECLAIRVLVFLVHALTSLSKKRHARKHDSRNDDHADGKPPAALCWLRSYSSKSNSTSSNLLVRRVLYQN